MKVEEIGWLVETEFGPHTHYLGLTDPRENWREYRGTSGYRALAGILTFHKEAGKALRFARKEDAETFIAAFGRLLVEPRATEHIWPSPEAATALTDQAGRIERLVEALKPFADFYDVASKAVDQNHEATYWTPMRTTVAASGVGIARLMEADFRKARSALLSEERG